MLDYDLLGGNFIGSIVECSRIFIFPRLILVAGRGSWGPCDDADSGRPPEMLWKPLDPQALYTKVCQLLASARAR